MFQSGCKYDLNFARKFKCFIFQAYIDYNDMAKSLHDKFPEYKRIKFKVFRVTVEDCFNKILTALNKESESPQKETYLHARASRRGCSWVFLQQLSSNLSGHLISDYQ